jgi:hypothetical protein
MSWNVDALADAINRSAENRCRYIERSRNAVNGALHNHYENCINHYTEQFRDLAGIARTMPRSEVETALATHDLVWVLG